MEALSIFISLSLMPVSYTHLDVYKRQVLDRKKEWKNKIVVTDVTGSMSPYTTQLLLWYKLHETEKDVNQFVFFNDGNMTPDDKKVIGATGGIYSCEGKAGYNYMAKQVSKACLLYTSTDTNEKIMISR